MILFLIARYSTFTLTVKTQFCNTEISKITRWMQIIIKTAATFFTW